MKDVPLCQHPYMYTVSLFLFTLEKQECKGKRLLASGLVIENTVRKVRREAVLPLPVNCRIAPISPVTSPAHSPWTS